MPFVISGSSAHHRRRHRRFRHGPTTRRACAYKVRDWRFSICKKVSWVGLNSTYENNEPMAEPAREVPTSLPRTSSQTDSALSKKLKSLESNSRGEGLLTRVPYAEDTWVATYENNSVMAVPARELPIPLMTFLPTVSPNSARGI
jgi:hypothetical protein